MKKILMTAVALTAMTATPAMAQQAAYTVSGNVGALCAATATGTLGFGSLIDSSGNLSTTNQEATDSAAYCNGGNTTIAVAHVNLTHATATSAPNGFTNVVSFVPVVTAGTTTFTGDTSATSVGAFLGLKVEAKSASVPANTRPLAGSYSGSITVTLTPGV